MIGIKDVAWAAGVSVGTVSNVLNRPDAVAPATRQRVESAIAELGYIRNESARHLRAGTSRTIALIALDVSNPFFADVIAGAEDEAAASGAFIVVLNSAGNPGREARHLTLLQSMGVMGVLITPVQDEQSSTLQDLQERGTPVVYVDRTNNAGPSSSVSVDDVEGGRLVGEHLRTSGHRRVTYLAGPLQLAQVRDRREGFARGLGDQVDLTQLEAETMSVRAGSSAAARFFATWPDPALRPTAIFCANDLLALGVLNECTRRGVQVPGDLAIVGYDDITFAATAAVPLSSVRQPRAQLGQTAVELLVEAVERASDGRAARHVRFVPELVLRESSRLHGARGQLRAL